MTEPWYYEIAGQGYGPITLDALKQLAAGGTITAATLVRQGARGRWERADRYKGLIAAPGGSTPGSLPVAAPLLPPPPVRGQPAAQSPPPPVQHKPPPVQQATPPQPPSGFTPSPAMASVTPAVSPAAPPVFVAPSYGAPAIAAPSQGSASYGVTPPAGAAQAAGFDPASDFSSSALPRISSASRGLVSHRAPRYDALVTVAKLYDVLAWVCLGLGALGVVVCLGLAVAVVASGSLGWQESLFAIGSQVVAAAILALYVFLMFTTLRALSQAILLAMDVETNTRRSNELLTDIRDHFRGGA